MFLLKLLLSIGLAGLTAMFVAMAIGFWGDSATERMVSVGYGTFVCAGMLLLIGAAWKL